MYSSLDKMENLDAWRKHFVDQALGKIESKPFYVVERRHIAGELVNLSKPTSTALKKALRKKTTKKKKVVPKKKTVPKKKATPKKKVAPVKRGIPKRRATPRKTGRRKKGERV